MLSNKNIVKKVKKQYKYNFPENKELAEGLMHTDPILIAKKTGYTAEYIRMILKGRRKANEKVKNEVIKLKKIREEYEKQ